MHLFLKFILAHLVADFILQFEELYRLKVKSLLGHFYHAAIHGVVMLALAYMYLGSPFFIIYMIALAVIHYYQDCIKYKLQARDPKNTFWYFTGDQVIHVAWLATAFLIPESYMPAMDPRAVATDNFWTICACVFIASTFKGSYLLFSFRKTFIKGSRPNHFITSFEVAHGLIERTFVTGCFLFLPLAAALPASLTIGLLRFGAPKLRSKLDFFLSWAYAAFFGILLHAWMPRI